MSQTEKLDRIRALEKEHVDIFNQLLRVLDELYLERSHESRKVIIKDEQESLLRLRRQMQKGLEESAAILRTLERIDKLDYEEKSESLSVEDILASRIKKLMDNNYKLETEAIQLINQRFNSELTIFEEESRFLNLRQQLNDLDELYGTKTDNTDRPPHAEPETSEFNALRRQNSALRELLTALKIHSGSGVVL